LSSADLVAKTAKEVYDAAPPPAKAAAEQVGKTINSAFAASADAAGYAYDAVTSKAAEAAEAAKPALDKVTQAANEAAASSVDVMGKAQNAVASKVAEAAAAAKPVVEDEIREVSEAAVQFFEGLPRWLRSRL